MSLFRFASIVLISLLVIGCASIGPDSIKKTRGNYNIAVQQTGNEQLLLNIVRLKYRDTPTFLELTSVTTSLSFETSAGTKTTFQKGVDPVELGVEATYADKPTITYTPLQGDKFVSQIMSPLKLETVALLYHSGWSVERILVLTAQHLNGLKNAPTASGPTPSLKPEYEEFWQVVRLLRQLQRDGAIQVGMSKGQAVQLELSINPESMNHARLQELIRLLGLESGQQRYPIIAGTGARKDAITINPRSLMAILFYVAQSVEVPPRDVQRGRVTVTKDTDGVVFDWTKMLENLIHIRSSDELPDNAYVAINYRDSWFYIDDSDLTSKSTFALLTQLSALAAGDTKSLAPVLTLPIGN
jgi:hypothetical protein